MSVFIAIEASQPDGTSIRMAFGCRVHLAPWLLVLARLF